MTDKPDEMAVYNCFRCGVPILTWWDGDGRGLLRGEYVLVADWVFHPKCWGELSADQQP